MSILLLSNEILHIFGTFLSKFLFGAFHLLFFGNKLTISIAIADAPDRADHALEKTKNESMVFYIQGAIP